MSLLSQWRPQKISLNHQIKISANILHHLDWWKQEEIYQQGVPLRINHPSHTIFTDASLSGWGFACGTGRTTVSWSLDGNPISATHKYAGNDGHFNGTKGSSSHNQEFDCVSLHRQHNSSGLSEKTRGTVLQTLEVREILNWCFQNKIQLLVKHIPGKFNTLADRLSRVYKPISTEWCLNQEVANAIFHMTQFPNIDLFATRLNHRLPLYVSPIPGIKMPYQ